MIGRLVRLWRGRRRALFRFDDGTRRRRVDPLIVAQLLALHEHYRPDHLTAAEEGDTAAQRIVAATARDVFGIEVWDERTARGLTEAECIALLLDFDRYLALLKKNTRLSSTSPRSGDATAPGSSEPTTSATSRYGAAGSGPLSGQQNGKGSPSSAPLPAG